MAVTNVELKTTLEGPRVKGRKPSARENSLKALVLFIVVAVVFAFAAHGRGDSQISSVKDIPVSEDYVLRVWGVDNGLPSSCVSSIAQTPDGYLWVATDEGLARFDGVTFTPFFADTTPGLQSDRWQIVFTDHAGNLWVGVEGGGISRRSNGRFEVIAPVPPWSSSRPPGFSSITEDGSGAIWFGAAGAATASRWQNGRLTSADGLPPGGDAVFELCRAGDGRIWYKKSNRSGVFCGVFDGRRFRTIDRATILRLDPAKDGKMWAARDNTLVKYGPDGKWEAVADIAALGGAGHVKLLYEDHRGDLWLGSTDEGLFRFRNGKFVRVPTSHASIRAIFEDREGNILVGTESGGLNCLRLRRFFLRPTKYGVSETMVISVCEDIEGKLWLLNRDGTVVRSQDATNSSFASPPGLDHLGRAVALCPDPSGGMWFAMSTGGVKHWKNGEVKMEPIKEDTTALLVDRKGDLWVAAISGPLLCLHQGVAAPVPTDGGLVNPRALAEDNAGRLWVGTEDGLVFRRENDRFIQVPVSGGESGGQVRFIVADGDQVWIGLERTGIYRWRAGKIEHLITNPISPIARVRSMLIDPDGEFWIGTAYGLCRAQRSEMEAAIDGRQNSMDWDWFGPSDGVPHVAFCFGFRNGAVRTHDGHLWFATYSGALEVASLDQPKHVPPVPVEIEECEVAGKALVASNGQLTLQSTPGILQVHYTLPELSDSEQIRFRYRMVGLGDGEWFSAGKQRVATFTNLPPGRFRFEVEACEPGGGWLPPASMAVKVPAIWWQTHWFRFVVAMFAAAMLAGSVRLIVKRRVQAKMRALEQVHALERERTRIARDIHDELGANLTQITIASRLVEREVHGPASERIRKIALMARSSVDSLDEIVWAVNPRYDSLPGLIEYIGKYAVNFTQTSGIACHIDFPSDIPCRPLVSNLRHNLFLVVKEALNNIVKYAEASNVRLKAEVSEDLLRLTIVDDGCGFEVGTDQIDANGLRNMRDRMAEIKGRFSLRSVPQGGTSICFELPFLK